MTIGTDPSPKLGRRRRRIDSIARARREVYHRRPPRLTLPRFAPTLGACSPSSTPAPSSGWRGQSSKGEVDTARGLPHFAIVGLPDTAVLESRERHGDL